MRTFHSVVEELIAGLRDFTIKLDNDEPLRVTTIRREETPDGPLHVREVRTRPAAELLRELSDPL